MHILLAVFLSVCIIRIKQYLYAEHSLLDAFNETTKYVALLISYWIILLESRAHRKRQRIFWQLFRSCGHAVYEDCDFLLTVAEYLVGSIIVNGIAIYWRMVPRDSWIAFMISGYANHLRILFHILHLQLIRTTLRAIEKSLLLHRTGDSATSRTISKTRYDHYLVCELITNVNETYSLAHLSTLLCQLYFCYSNLNRAYLHADVYTGFYIISAFLHRCEEEGRSKDRSLAMKTLIFLVSVGLLWAQYSMRVIFYEFRESSRNADLVKSNDSLINQMSFLEFDVFLFSQHMWIAFLLSDL